MGRPPVNLTGKRFGKLVAWDYAGSNKDGKSRWLCMCDCGQTKVVLAGNLQSCGTRSCGKCHLARLEDIYKKRGIKHG